MLFASIDQPTGRQLKPPLYHRPGLGVQRYAAIFDLCAVHAPPQLPGQHLWLDELGLRLCDASGASSVELNGRELAARSRQALLLARACGASNRPVVADLLAGWGTDGLSLAMRGCPVTLVERAPVVWALLEDFVTQLDVSATVVFASAEDWCRANRRSVDVAYLDPMFASRRKMALPEKRMQLLRKLAWREGADLAELINLARLAARRRVVVKRRAKEPVYGAPAWQIRGRRIRFDVYSC